MLDPIATVERRRGGVEVGDARTTLSCVDARLEPPSLWRPRYKWDSTLDESEAGMDPKIFPSQPVRNSRKRLDSNNVGNDVNFCLHSSQKHALMRIENRSDFFFFDQILAFSCEVEMTRQNLINSPERTPDARRSLLTRNGSRIFFHDMT